MGFTSWACKLGKQRTTTRKKVEKTRSDSRTRIPVRGGRGRTDEEEEEDREGSKEERGGRERWREGAERRDGPARLPAVYIFLLVPIIKQKPGAEKEKRKLRLFRRLAPCCPSLRA